MLVKDAGYTLADIRGNEERVVRYKDPSGLLPKILNRISFLPDPSPNKVVEVRNESGMDEEEVIRRLVYHDEIERIREEEHEDKMKEIRRKQQNMG